MTTRASHDNMTTIQRKTNQNLDISRNFMFVAFRCNYKKWMLLRVVPHLFCRKGVGLL